MLAVRRSPPACPAKVINRVAFRSPKQGRARLWGHLGRIKRALSVHVCAVRTRCGIVRGHALCARPGILARCTSISSSALSAGLSARTVYCGPAELGKPPPTIATCVYGPVPHVVINSVQPSPVLVITSRAGKIPKYPSSPGSACGRPCAKHLASPVTITVRCPIGQHYRLTRSASIFSSFSESLPRACPVKLPVPNIVVLALPFHNFP